MNNDNIVFCVWWRTRRTCQTCGHVSTDMEYTVITALDQDEAIRKFHVEFPESKIISVNVWGKRLDILEALK